MLDICLLGNVLYYCLIGNKSALTAKTVGKAYHMIKTEKTGQEKPKDNEKKQPKESTGKNVCIKINSMLEFAYMYLEMLRNVGIKCDKEFYRRYENLMEYVYGKIELPECEILDEYHVYEVTLR